MYLRTIKGRNKKYLAIVAGERQGTQVRQKLLCNLGAIDELNQAAMLEMGGKIMAMFGGIGIGNPQKLEEDFRRNWGAPAVVETLWNEFRLEQCFNNLCESRRLQFDLKAAIKLMITDRLCDPCSKLKTFSRQNYYDNIPEISLQDLYKSLDELDCYQEEICEHVFKQQKQFSGEKVDVIFFDVTTLYFESKVTDGLRDFGYSKDCKFNDVQVVLSLIVDIEGRPLAYGLFPGNMYEGSSLLPNLEKLRSKYKINKVTIVADRGMCSFDNLNEVGKAGFNYIVGTRLRSAGKELKEKALSDKGYEVINSDNDDCLKYKLIERKLSKKGSNNIREQVVCIWSERRAAKDKKDRGRLIEKAYSMVASKSINDKRGAKKYLKIKQGVPKIHQAKIENDQRWDGYYAISTNCRDFTAQAIMAAYHNLWKIEESFRTLKSHFEARPMFHWTPKRISGHILLNFIALVIEKHLELALKKHGITPSHQKVREALCAMEKSEYSQGKIRLTMHSRLDELQTGILKVMRVPIPANAATML